MMKGFSIKFVYTNIYTVNWCILDIDSLRKYIGKLWIIKIEIGKIKVNNSKNVWKKKYEI